MKRDLTIALIACVLIAAALATGVFLGWRMGEPSKPPEPAKPQVDTVWVKDSANLVDFKPVGSVIATLPIVRPTAQKEPGIEQNPAQFAQELPDSAQAGPAIVHVLPDSATVEIPIERRTYEGENYRAVVQGFRPELISIDIRQPNSAPPKRKWWSVTVGPQVGYGFTPKGWQPYAGVGVTVGITF